MDKKVLIVLAAVLTASGCIGPSTDGSSSQGKGLVIEEFSVTDKSLSGSQRGKVNLLLKNYHKEDIEVTDISLFNTGSYLEAGEKTCNPSPENLGRFKKDIAPEMECTWVLDAEAGFEGFDSKKIPLKLNLEYNTSLTPENALKVNFRPLDEIGKTEEVRREYSNGEIDMVLSSESPIPYSQPGNLNVKVSGTGKGRIDGGYTFSYQPPAVLKDCVENHGAEDTVVGSQVEFSCGVSGDKDSGAATTRNLLVSTHYKYVKQPTLDIRVVNNQ